MITRTAKPAAGEAVPAMTTLTRRKALGLLAAVAVPSAGTVAVATAKPEQPVTLEEMLSKALPAERVRYFSNMLMEAMAEMHPGYRFFSNIDHDDTFALIFGRKAK